MPLLSAVVETNDRLAEIVSHEIANHAAAADLMRARAMAGADRESA